MTPLLIVKMTADILFFTRLFKTNITLWFWEWLFHFTFLLVIIRHLRYIMNPVPEWVSSLQDFGLIAGYVLPFALLVIFLLKMKIEKKQYVSNYNFFLLGIVLFLSITGLLMKFFFRPDIAGIKFFVIEMFAFKPGVLSDGFLFTAHFAAALVLLVYLPAHIFAAPLTMIEARKRDEELEGVLHGK